MSDHDQAPLDSDEIRRRRFGDNPETPSEIPVDPFGPEKPGSDWWREESVPPGWEPGKPLPPGVPPGQAPDSGVPDTIPDGPDTIPDGPDTVPNPTLPSPDVPGPPSSPGPGIPVEPGPPSVDPMPEPIPPGPDTLPSPGIDDYVDDAIDLAAEYGDEALLAAESAYLVPELLVAASGVGGYMLGDYIAPYVYGDKNIDGSPVVRYEDVEDEPSEDYRESFGWKVNEWLESW